MLQQTAHTILPKPVYKIPRTILASHKPQPQLYRGKVTRTAEVALHSSSSRGACKHVVARNIPMRRTIQDNRSRNSTGQKAAVCCLASPTRAMVRGARTLNWLWLRYPGCKYCRRLSSVCLSVSERLSEWLPANSKIRLSADQLLGSRNPEPLEARTKQLPKRELRE